MNRKRLIIRYLNKVFSLDQNNDRWLIQPASSLAALTLVALQDPLSSYFLVAGAEFSYFEE